MTEYTFAQIAAGVWSEKVQRRQDAIVKQAANDLLFNIPIKAGTTRGGTRELGSIPRDTGALASSLQSSLYGSTSIQQTGAPSYVAVVGSMKAGDVAEFSWGGAIAPHARANHYGYKGLTGTFWVPEAMKKWQGYVTAAAERADREIP